MIGGELFGHFVVAWVGDLKLASRVDFFHYRVRRTKDGVAGGGLGFFESGIDVWYLG